MIPRRLFILALGAAFGSALLVAVPPGSESRAAEAAGSAFDILSRSDIIRNPQESFVVDVNLTAYEHGKIADSTQVTTHSRKDGGGQFLSLVHIDQPVRDVGKLLLRNGNLIWFYDPASKASVRLSQRQRLIGNASNGDVITANFALDYAVELVGEETITDGDRKDREAFKLHLVSRTDTTPYDAIEFWVEKGTYRPIKGMFYTQSGRLLKAAWYRGWNQVMGMVRPTEIVIADGFDPQNVTVMRLMNYRQRNMPESWFSKSWLPSFRRQ